MSMCRIRLGARVAVFVMERIYRSRTPARSHRVPVRSGRVAEPIWNLVASARRRSQRARCRIDPEPESAMKMTRLVPMLPVRSVAASIEFYRKLGFSVERRNDGWGWAMLAFGDCRLMLDQSINVHPPASRQSIVYLYPDDVAEYHRQVRTSGLAVPDLDVTFYGMTEFRLCDPDGNQLWIGQEPATVSGG